MTAGKSPVDWTAKFLVHAPGPKVWTVFTAQALMPQRDLIGHVWIYCVWESRLGWWIVGWVRRVR